jgi:hypothetical protein
MSEILSVDLTIARNFLVDISEKMFNVENLAIQAVDLTPTNIFVLQDSEVLFSDFEWLGLENYMLDIAFLWLLLWRYPDWQKKLAEGAIGEEDLEYFQANIIRIILYAYEKLLQPDLSIKQEKYYRELLAGHVWTKYLIHFPNLFFVSNEKH